MKRIAVICLIVVLMLIPIMGVNCESLGNGDGNNNDNTDTAAPRISGFTVANITETTATISWATDESATSNIEYGPNTSYGHSFSSPSDTTADKTSHSLRISGLSPDTTYHFRIKSADKAGNEAISGDKTFITTTLFVDNTPPDVSNITVSNITDTGAIIAWATDKTATSQIEYGTTSGYGSITTLDTNMVNTHSFNLTGLIVNTDYHYRVKSTDASGNEAISGDYNFTTSSVLIPVATLSGQPTGTVDYSTADIIVAGTGVISYKYKLDGGAWSTETPVSTHIILSNLANGLHTISVVGKDAAGNWQTEALPTTTSWTVNTIIIFPDAKLETYIRQAIGKPQGDIYQADLVGLTGLNIGAQPYRGVTNLTGLEHCINLTWLSLRYNRISNISSLSGLTKLTSLDLLGNQTISDISPLSSLINLTSLGLGDNQITDIGPLVNNIGLGQGDSISLWGNPLNTTSLTIYIPALKSRGVAITY